MIRLIKRYESRKLYDTEDSRYVSLAEIADLVRGGQDVRVLDNGTEQDVTTQTLAQVILEEGRSGERTVPSQRLHELIREGSKRLRDGVGQVQSGIDRLLVGSLERVTPLREVRQEVDRLRQRLGQLEVALDGIERRRARGPAADGGADGAVAGSPDDAGVSSAPGAGERGGKRRTSGPTPRKAGSRTAKGGSAASGTKSRARRGAPGKRGRGAEKTDD